jgi:hypothetical protein
VTTEDRLRLKWEPVGSTFWLHRASLKSRPHLGSVSEVPIPAVPLPATPSADQSLQKPRLYLENQPLQGFGNIYVADSLHIDIDAHTSMEFNRTALSYNREHRTPRAHPCKNLRCNMHSGTCQCAAYSGQHGRPTCTLQTVSPLLLPLRQHKCY